MRGLGLLRLIATLFLCTITASGQTLQVLHAFTGSPDGAFSWSSLIHDKSGRFYGTTEQGGSLTCADPFSQCGTVFELTPILAGTQMRWTETPVYAFQGGTDGAGPESGLSPGRNGTFLATTEAGGGMGCVASGCGTVIAIRRDSKGWSEEVLYRFSGGTDGANPVGPVVLGPDNALYGTTVYGGNPVCSQYGPGCGTVFKLEQTSAGWTETVIHEFTGPDGAYPYAGVAFDSAGNIYGTTTGGGNGKGVIFELIPNNGTWSEAVLYNFSGGDGDGIPAGGVVLDKQGNVYGATEFGGDYGTGSVFELTPSGDGWNLEVLHSFSGYDGWFPRAGISIDQAGNLYGTTFGSNSGECQNGCGLVYMLKRANGWAETVLHSFTGGADGAYPGSSLLLYGNGLYGTTTVGGDSQCSIDPPFAGCGVVYRISP